MKRGNLTILKAEVQAIDVAGRSVTVDGGERIAWDHLIVAAGATHSYFGHDEWAAHAPGLKTLADAFDIRARVIGAFEQRRAGAERRPSRDAWMTFAVIGGGPTGVEMAGTMSEIAQHTLPKEFRRIDSTRTRVVLLEGSRPGARRLRAAPFGAGARAARSGSASRSAPARRSPASTPTA